jgi:hypothetical protein
MKYFIIQPILHKIMSNIKKKEDFKKNTEFYIPTTLKKQYI